LGLFFFPGLFFFFLDDFFFLDLFAFAFFLSLLADFEVEAGLW